MRKINRALLDWTACYWDERVAAVNAATIGAAIEAYNCKMMPGGGFQTQVNVQPAPAVEGDFCSTNPRFTFDAGPGGLVTGASGVRVGYFAWATAPLDPNSGPSIANNFGSGPVTGFVHREQQGLITTFLADAAMTVPQGFPITLFTGGDFWVKNNGTTQAVLGQKAFANYANGQVSFAASGSINTGQVTGSIGAATSQFVASISGDIMTVTSVTSGTIVAGGAISGGTGVVANTVIVSQLSGTVGGAGTYLVNIGEQNVQSALLTESYGILNVTAVTSGAVGVGDLLTGSGVSTNTFVTQLGTGSGGTGTYYVNNSQTVGSITITVGLNVETKWYAMSGGLPGELVKISDHPLG